MHRRNRNIIFFFEENDNVRCISSKMVRLYMNRFIIDEEERFEISGVFNLAKIPKIGQQDRRSRLWNVSMMNWIEDRQLIKDVFEKLKIWTWLSTDIFIFMGTSLSLDVLNNNNSLNKLVRNLGEKCSSSTSILMTVMKGENHVILHTKNHVRNAYRYQENFPSRSQSLNDCLEIFFAAMISTNTDVICLRGELIHEVKNLFLYEMQNEDEIKTKPYLIKPDLIRRSDDHQYLLSLCKVSTVYFK